jgi:hypothetical protein
MMMWLKVDVEEEKMLLQIIGSYWLENLNYSSNSKQ